MRTLCLDLGGKRIGVAVSDELGWLARPLLTYNRIGPRKDIENLVRIANEYEVGTIVIGLPISLRGEEGIEAGKAREFGASLAAATDIAVVYWDERLSTVQADKLLLRQGIPAKKRKLMIDSNAAAIILQSYLDAHSDSNFLLPPPPP
jgi:putative Holliday junction resolvase